ncbi:glycosyltransferase family 4 protein [Natrialbaceae archaeon A-gly3]
MSRVDAGELATRGDGDPSSTRREATSERTNSSDAGEPAPEEMRVLVVTGLAHKNARHYGPLADVASEVTLVSLDPEYAIDEGRYVPVPQVGPRIVRILLLFFLALYEGYREDYDAVASISLLPYGFYALALRGVYGYPAHLGIIGVDLDHHAHQWYGAVPRAAFRRFDAVSVPGRTHARELARMGVPEDRIEILTNAIDVETYRPLEDAPESEYDLVWVGRFSAEKAPLRFVEILAELENEREVRAAMVGDGPLRPAVREALEDAGLAGRVDLPGWVDEPVEYYRHGEVFVLTSRRDAMPLVMLEAMATGLPPVVPPVGSIPDVIEDGENGLVVSGRDPETFAAAIEDVLGDEPRRRAIGEEAATIAEEFSLERAGEDWRTILGTLTRR